MTQTVAEDVVLEPFDPNGDFVHVIRPASAGVDLQEWGSKHQEIIDELLLKHCAILFRGFDGVATSEAFERFIGTTAHGNLVPYRYGSTPRYQVSGNVYTTTIYPPDRSIPMHNEMSYCRTWPLKLWLRCDLPPAEGGETPVSDSRRVLARIDPQIRDEFIDKKVMYVRNYGELIDVPWQKSFVTEDRAEVEAFCAESDIECEWLDGGGLRTRQVCQAIAEHPKTGDAVWFNQAHLFHASNLPPERRKVLRSVFADDELPRNAYFGDGSPIPDATLDEIRKAYDAETAKFPWQKGDVAIVDNMLAAHAREPFKGKRMIWIGMAEPYSPGNG